LIFSCEFLNFSTSRSTLDLAGRGVINDIEGREDINMNEYLVPGSQKYTQMIDRIRQSLRLTTLQYQKLEDLVDAIGLPKERLCTHCWDGSSYF
jgi:amidophosphoribosyltransferase